MDHDDTQAYLTRSDCEEF